MELVTDSKQGMQQTKFHARHLVQVEVPVHPFSSILQPHFTWARKSTDTMERGRPYHKTIAVIFASRLLQVVQVGGDQWPHIPMMLTTMSTR